jgi:tripartite-type tricarboxylate transporter receptor subunit TctC
MINRRAWLRATPLLLPVSWATAQPAAFPAKPIRYLVPVAAGGGSDFVGRTICERWGKVLGQTFVVENMGGGGGAIATTTTAKAAPDGYTLMQAYVSTHSTSPATRTRLGYDPQKDFTPVGMIGGTPNVLVVNANLPFSSLRELVDHARRNPGKISYGSAGMGSLTQLVMELFKQEANLFMVHVPYRGIAPAFTDLLGGQTQAMFAGLAAALPHIRSGRVRALAVTGAVRHPTVKDVPTMIEAGYKGFDALQWYGVAGPAGMPAAVLKQLNDSLNVVLQQPDLRDKLAGEALEPMPMAPDAFARYMQADLQRWVALAKARKIQLDE